MNSIAKTTPENDPFRVEGLSPEFLLAAAVEQRYVDPAEISDAAKDAKMIDPTAGCPDCGTLDQNHDMPCRIALLQLIERYGDLRQQVGNLGGTRYGHFAGDRNREAEEILREVAAQLSELFAA